MFWNSIIEGTELIFFNWEILIGIFIMGLITLLVFKLNLNFILNFPRYGRILIIVINVIESIMLTIFLSLTLPLFLGKSEITSFDLILQNFKTLLFIGLFSAFLTSVIQFIPIIGQFFTNILGLVNLTQSIIITYCIFNYLNMFNFNSQISIGIWLIFSIIAITYVISFLIIGLLNTMLNAIFGEASAKPIQITLGCFLVFLPAIFTISIYCTLIRI